MVTATTSGIQVSVGTEYQEEYSSPSQYHYVFTYRISITNKTNSTIQLLKRHWFIYDSTGAMKEVIGNGVVGNQPVIEPGESYEYVSGCNFKSGLGKMKGSYSFKKIIDDQPFEVVIPEFVMNTPYLLN